MWRIARFELDFHKFSVFFKLSNLQGQGHAPLSWLFSEAHSKFPPNSSCWANSPFEMLCESRGNPPGLISTWHKNCSWKCYFVVWLSLLSPHFKVNPCILQQKVWICDNQNSADIGPIWTFNMGELEFFGSAWITPIFKSKSSPSPRIRVIQVRDSLSTKSAISSRHPQ